jgi:hypothetical protein
LGTAGRRFESCCPDQQNQALFAFLPALCFPEIAFGKPFPWTAEKIEAAKSLADELENLSAEDRAALKIAIDDVAPKPERRV